MTKVKQGVSLARMRQAGVFLRQLLNTLRENIVVGQSGVGLNALAEQFFAQKPVTSNFYNYHGFPAYICVSVNDHLIHGIPTDVQFKKGDIVSVDAGCIYRRYHSDAAFTVIVGGLANNEADAQLVTTTNNVLRAVQAIVVPDVAVGTIGAFIEQFVTKAGFYCPKNYAGHGIGTKMHEAPLIFNYGLAENGVRLKIGQTVCIEPMVQQGTEATVTLADGWTVANASHQNSAHVEATFLITADGAEILT